MQAGGRRFESDRLHFLSRRWRSRKSAGADGGAAVTVDGLVGCIPEGCGDTSETRPAALSGILEREPGDVLGEHVLSHGEDDQLLCVRVTHIARGKP